jgi:hypothetical protein
LGLLNLMKNNPVFLLSHSIEIIPSGLKIAYDEKRCVNVLSESERTPAVLSEYGITHSKTDSAVGDDDPDPSQDKCY